MSTPYTFTYPIDPTSGDTVQSAFINNAGEVVGTYTDSAFATHGFVDIGGVISTYNDGSNTTTDVTAVDNGGTFVGFGTNGVGGVPTDWFIVSGGVAKVFATNGVNIQPVAINAGGTVVGRYNSAGFIGTAAGGVTSVVSVTGATTTTISGINAGGTIVGDYNDATGVQHGFIDVGGVFTTVDPAGSVQTFVNAVNTGGDAAGTFQDASGNTSGFVDAFGLIATFALPANYGAVVTGVSDSGAVVGYYLGSTDLLEHGFVLSNGVVTTINVSGSPNTEILGVNAGGMLVGIADDASGNGTEHGFVATPACYCPGTLIGTPAGPVAIEALRIGDTVLTASGPARPVKWIGRRAYGRRFVRANPDLRPVRIRAGALGDGLPARDLLVSAEHGLFLDGALVPARHLVNGAGIVRDAGLGDVSYLHIELDSHDVILAEGAAAETFVDDDSRRMFHNAAEFATLYPDRAAPARFCAPRLEHGYALEAIRNRLGGSGQVAA